MDILQFLVTPKTVNFRGVKITYNADAFTPEFLRKAAQAYKGHYQPVLDALPDTNPVESDEAEPRSEKQTALVSLNRAVDRFERSASTLEVERDVFAALLAGTPDNPVIMEWDLTRNGDPIPITEEVLRQMKPQIITDLWACIRDAADPKSPEIPQTSTSQTISATTNARSSSRETNTDTGPIM